MSTRGGEYLRSEAARIMLIETNKCMLDEFGYCGRLWHARLSVSDVRDAAFMLSVPVIQSVMIQDAATVRLHLIT